MALDPDLFGDVLDYPDPIAQERFDGLIGIDDVKQRLVTEAVNLLSTFKVSEWSKKHHGKMIKPAVELMNRTPLIILGGDVGTGKTELAQSFLAPVTSKLKGTGVLYSLSLSARGRGAVGEMTSLISSAFSSVKQAGLSAKNGNHVIVLFIDEGDALAQSREMSQMHHEDRAGVNALIRGIDDLKRDNLPILTVLCTNRANSLDPAIKRRAAAVFSLERPNDNQRRELLNDLLDEIKLSSSEIEMLVLATGKTENRSYGMTYSDIRQRLLPEAVLAAMPDSPLTFDLLIDSASRVEPTTPFAGG
jgi:AAA+ superfamily predicted ATPase